MITVALKGLLGRKTRAILTALAVVLGVSMVSGTYVLTDTIKKAFNGVFESTYKNTSVVISGKEIVKGAASGNATVSAKVLDKVRALPDVQAAAGGIINFGGSTDLVKLIDRNGNAIGGKGGAPTFGFGLDPKYPQFNPMKLVEGKWATGSDQVVVRGSSRSRGSRSSAPSARSAPRRSRCSTSRRRRSCCARRASSTPSPPAANPA
ncbi:MAG: ABC transporter permease [Chloroflexi bacterium]|nr:MAG: ABC transporter permease [Chloroflexota bacterium]